MVDNRDEETGRAQQELLFGPQVLIPWGKRMNMQRIGIGQGIIIAVLVALLVGVGILAVSAWTSTSGVVISREGWVALSLGTFFSLVVGCGLITLVFYSSRHGYDEAVNEFSQGQAKALAEREEEEPRHIAAPRP
jgi:hypothetical protein